jgi:hypothetical protein
VGHAAGDADRGADEREGLMSRIVGFTVAAAAIAAAAPPASAQTWRTVTSARQTHGERELTVDVQYGVGRFSLAPGPAGTLYRMEMRYDEERFTPVRAYDPASGVLRLGVRGRHGRGARITIGDRRRSGPPPTFDLALSPDIPLSLTLELGAVESDVELGGLALRSLTYRTGASESSVRFSQPNPVACGELAMEAGAAQLHVTGIANANCQRVRFQGGVGEVTLDFSGEWRQSMDADVDVSIGSLNLRLPRDVGVMIRLSRFLASFESAGFVKRGRTYYSSNYESARHRLTLDINATIGGVDVAWVNR